MLLFHLDFMEQESYLLILCLVYQVVCSGSFERDHTLAQVLSMPLLLWTQVLPTLIDLDINVDYVKHILHQIQVSVL